MVKQYPVLLSRSQIVFVRDKLASDILSCRGLLGSKRPKADAVRWAQKELALALQVDEELKHTLRVRK